MFLQRLFYLCLACFLISCSAANHQTEPAKQLQKGIIKEDTSFVYRLPFATETSYFVVQGYYSRYSHKNRVAIDFKMKKGTGIYAARSGVVTSIKEDGTKGGWKKKYRSEGNFIVIQHADSSSAGYWHLQQNAVLVNVGDSIAEGQLIGLSGRTGYSLFPHLHFMVWRLDNLGKRLQLATRFKTSKGNIYLRPFRKYHHTKF